MTDQTLANLKKLMKNGLARLVWASILGLAAGVVLTGADAAAADLQVVEDVMYECTVSVKCVATGAYNSFIRSQDIAA